ncbi:MAG: 3-dehydroquinate synthase [Lachnospiraceae bacterium]|nr:3-dehydroquinate synthase [Lachnospiraceae bacterium]
MRCITVSASIQYEIRIGSGLLPETGAAVCALGGIRKVMLVSDDRVAPLYAETAARSLEDAGLETHRFVFPHGEASKNWETLGRVLEALCAAGLTRSDCVAALGGGVTGDLAGLAAALYGRGIRYVQLPTSLLAAVDSSVGGKTAVDLSGGKNMAGCFHQPSLVLCDTDTLRTLPEEEYRSGCAEIIKYAMIGSEALFETLEGGLAAQEEAVIAACADQKRKLVEEDEFDNGARMLLNFGHTFGHAAEALSGFSIRHGEGVAMGMAAVTRAAERRGICEAGTARRLEELLRAYGLPVSLPFEGSEMAAAARSDKKARGDAVHLVVPERIGRCRTIRVPAASLAGWLS